MKFTYDKEADAAYIYLRKICKSSRTQRIADNIILDFDANGKLLGIEILNISSCMAPRELKSAGFQMLTA
jgi:uncharacterized protein YuzE